jgi:hypothetical protein
VEGVVVVVGRATTPLGEQRARIPTTEQITPGEKGYPLITAEEGRKNNNPVSPLYLERFERGLPAAALLPIKHHIIFFF